MIYKCIMELKPNKMIRLFSREYWKERKKKQKYWTNVLNFHLKDKKWWIQDRLPHGFFYEDGGYGYNGTVRVLFAPDGTNIDSCDIVEQN